MRRYGSKSKRRNYRRRYKRRYARVSKRMGAVRTTYPSRWGPSANVPVLVSRWRTDSTPDITRMKCVYKHVPLLQFQNAVGPKQYFTLRGNGAFDPDSTLGGNYASGFKAMEEQYYQYHTVGAKVEATFLNQSTVVQAISCIASASLVTTAGFNLQSFVGTNSRYLRQCLLPAFGSGAAGIRKFKMYVPTTGILGPRNVNQNSDTNGVPTQQWYFNFLTVSSDETTALTNAGVITDIKITYYVEFFNKKPSITTNAVDDTGL